MARIPVHDLDSTPEASADTLERTAAKIGRVLNIHGAMAASPLLLDLYDTMEQMLGARSSLGSDVRRAIHLTVAAVNECDYCQAAYTGAARHTGFTVEQTKQIRQGFVDDRDDVTVVLHLAREIAARKGYVHDLTWKEALAAGWTEEQLLEVFAEVVRTIFTNYFNHLAETELDLPPAPPIS